MKINYKHYQKQFSNIVLTTIAYGFFYCVAYLIPVRVASFIGYVLGSTLLYYFPLPRKKEIFENIKKAFPEKSLADVKKIYKGACANFAQNIFEMPKLEKFAHNPKYVFITDPNGVLNGLGSEKVLLFSAHIGNWNIASMPLLPLQNSYTIYKVPNNKYVDGLMLRAMLQDYKQFKNKKITLSKKVVLSLSQQLKTSAVAILMYVDQRIREGLDSTTFFGRKTHTSHFLPMLAIKYNVKMVPIYVIRHSFFSRKPFLELVIEKPLNFESSGEDKADMHNLTQMMNDRIEEWVKNNPQQWFWLHRRW
jgi:KDO2-lipid IV(A) lauroyltransferase